MGLEAKQRGTGKAVTYSQPPASQRSTEGSWVRAVLGAQGIEQAREVAVWN